MKISSYKIIKGIKKYAKDLSDDEVLSLYKKVKEKLEEQPISGDQVLDGEKFSDEPMSDENNSLIPENTQIDEIKEENDIPLENNSEENTPSEEDLDEGIDELLNSLGLGEEKSSVQSIEEPIKEASIEDFETLKPKVIKFRKKPVIVDVLLFTGTNTNDLAEFMGIENAVIENDKLIIDTLEGKMQADKGDWIIKGVNGEFYPCKPDIFEKTYEPVKDEEFLPSNFKTAKRGFQLNRKDKDLMADDIEKPKYKDDGRLPPRTDCRRPNGIRWNKDEVDKDVEGDKDLKL